MTKDKTFIVYMATNTSNGKRYIGATSRGLIIRKTKHLQDARATRPGCRVFNAAIRKYGNDAFEWAIVSTLNSFQEMMQEEIRLIADLKPEYNITRGGQGIVGVPRTPEWTAKVVAKLKGRKMSEAQRQKLIGREQRHAFKSIVCLNDGMFFESIKAAASHYGIRKKSVSEVLSKRSLACGGGQGVGFSFVYSDRPLSIEEIEAEVVKIKEERIDGKRRRAKSKSRPVVCLMDGIEYSSARAAATKYGITPSRIMQLCQLGGATQSGLSFKYSDQEHAPIKRVRTEAEIEGQRSAVLAALKRGQAKIKKRVVLVESGEIFDSVADAARKYKIHEPELYYLLDKGFSHPLSGFTFRKLDADGKHIVVKPAKNFTVRRVLCVNDMTISDSVLSASKKYSVARPKLIRILSSGEEFSYLDEWCGNPA